MPSAGGAIAHPKGGAFKGELGCHCEERSLGRDNPLFEEIASTLVSIHGAKAPHSTNGARNDMWAKVNAPCGMR